MTARWLLFLAVLPACGAPQLVTVTTGPRPSTAQPIAVDFPPPPAKVEEIAVSTGGKGACVWRDGYWDWTGRRWDWQPGRAVIPPAGCRYAEPKLEWTTDSLSFYRPAWYPNATSSPASKACTEVACLPTGSPSVPTP